MFDKLTKIHTHRSTIPYPKSLPYMSQNLDLFFWGGGRGFYKGMKIVLWHLREHPGPFKYINISAVKHTNIHTN